MLILIMGREHCIQDFELALGDGTTKIVLNIKGTADDVSPEMRRLFEMEISIEEIAKATELPIEKIREIVGFGISCV